MRIDALRLTAFGPFSGAGLNLSAGRQGLHVIYGPNEAGKSSCLRALHGLLFGIPERSPDNFVHPHTQMRIGGSLRMAGGQALEFVRRKARKSSLRDGADDAPLADDALARFLPGVDESLFKSLFALNHDRLVEGGHEIARGGGQIGELLFAAGAGVAELRGLQTRLKTEADELFKSGGRNPRINQGLSEHKAARERLKEAQLSVDSWKQRDDALRETLARKQELDAQLQAAQTELARLRRIQGAQAPVSQWKDKQVQLRACGDAPLLTPDFAERREKTAQALQTAEQSGRESAAAIEQLQQLLAKIDLPEPLLAEVDAIELLKERLGSHRKAMSDRPRLQTALELAEHDLGEMLRALGHDALTADVDAWQLPDHVRVAIDQLGRQHATLSNQLESERRECDRLQREIAEAERELTASTPARPLGPLQTSLRRLQQQLELQGRLATALQNAAGLQREAEAQRRQLSGFEGSLDSLAQIAVPSEEAIDRFETQRAKLDARCAELRGDEAELRTVLDDAQARLQTLDATVAVPTADDLQAARALRERLWRLVLADWQKTPVDPEDVAALQSAFPAARDLADAYRQSVIAADETADRLRREADRVAEKAGLLVRIEQLESRHVDIQRHIEEVTCATSAWQEDWQQAWQASGVAPAPPAEMRSWRRRHQEIVAQVAGLETQREQARDLQTQMARAHSAATTLLSELGGVTASNDEPLDGLVDSAAARLDELRVAESRREELRRRLPQLRSALEEATARLAAVEKNLAVWRTQWSDRMRDLRLAPDSTTEQAASVLDTLTALFQKRRERQQLALRVQGIDTDARQFALDASATAQRLAPDLAERPLEAVVTELSGRLNAARQAATRRAELQRQLSEQQDRRSNAQHASTAAAAQLAELCHEAGCDSPDKLREAQRRSEQRRELQDSIGALQQQLATAAAGRELAALVAEVDTHPADALPAAIDELTSKVTTLSADRDAVLQAAAAERAELQRMSGQAGAIARAEECQALLARLEGDVNRLAVLWLAGAVLRKTVERYRDKNQGVVLEFASEIFALLTGGSFTGLRADIEEDQPVLVGVKASGGQLVRVDGMSEGTRDQLFLALRLASVRAWLADREPVPLVLDDVLVNFDDDRSSAALTALAALAEHVQIIFFTHHRHLLDIARKSVPTNQLFIHELSATPSPSGRGPG